MDQYLQLTQKNFILMVSIFILVNSEIYLFLKLFPPMLRFKIYSFLKYNFRILNYSKLSLIIKWRSLY